MFFPRLRRQAKWAFALLAVAFGLMFLVAGVGTGLGSGIGDYLSEIFNRQPQAGTGPSVEEARERAQKNPKDPAAQLALAEALQADGQTDEAIAALEAYTALRPEDTDALQQLAGLYEIKASEAQDKAAKAQAESQAVLFEQDLQASGNKLETALLTAPISDMLEQQATESSTAALTELTDAYRSEAEVYRKLTALVPDDPALFFELGRTSQLSGDYPGAISAYQQFLELAPDDPDAPLVREQLKALRAQMKITAP